MRLSLCFVSLNPTDKYTILTCSSRLALTPFNSTLAALRSSVVPGNRESVNTVLRTSFDPLPKGALLRLIVPCPFTKFPKSSRPMNALGLKGPPITRAREARQFPTNRMRESFARVLACGPAKRQSFSKHKARAEKGERECARWIRARPSPHICLRQATTPTSRRWSARGFRVLWVFRVKKWRACEKAHARSAKRAYSAG